MNYFSRSKRKIANKKSVSILLAVAIIVVGGLILKKVADSQSKVEF
jgi:hypothetical protein